MLAPVWRNAMFNGGGAILHKLYWENLRPDGAAPTKPGPRTLASLQRDFGSVNEALREIRDVGLGIQGSGWSVLAYSPELRQLVVMPVGNHQNEVLVGARPLLVLDVWEHAYYLDRKNNRKAYLDALLPRIAWDVVERRLVAAERV
jgi:Fe-Mn family superoxide dismutase